MSDRALQVVVKASFPPKSKAFLTKSPLINFLEDNCWTIAGVERRMEDSLGTIEEELEQLELSTGEKSTFSLRSKFELAKSSTLSVTKSREASSYRNL